MTKGFDQTFQVRVKDRSNFLGQFEAQLSKQSLKISSSFVLLEKLIIFHKEFLCVIITL